MFWYEKRQQTIFRIIKYIGFDTAYDPEKSLRLAGLYDVEYAVLPESEHALQSYIHQASGCGTNFSTIARSLGSGAYSEIVDQYALISVTDINGVITSANEKFAKVSGYSQEELVGKKHNILKSNKHPAKFYQDMWKTIRAGQSWRGNICNRNKMGDFYWVDSFIFPVKDAAGNIRAYVSFRYEITEEVQLKQKLMVRDKRFRISHEFANVGTWDWNIVTGELYWSEEIHRLFGYDKPVLETNYVNFIQAIHPDDRDLVVSRVNESMHSGSLYSVEHRVIHPNGNIRWLSERGRVMHDENGVPSRMLGVVSDIHELIEAKKEALLAEQLKSTFISMLSHEIRNPLNAAMGFSRIIADSAKNHDIVSYAAKIGSIMNHINGILDDIDLNNKLESNSVCRMLVPVELNKIVAESAEIVLARPTGIAIHYQNITGCVLADAQHLRQVLINLLNNAVKYNRKNGSVFIRTLRAGENAIRIEIEDTGYGIEANSLDKLFKPYERLTWANSEIEGLGLGLPICKGLIMNMGGKIGVTSEQDKGSTFWIELPATYSSQTLDGSKAELQAIPQIKPSKVLVLDDDEFIREFMIIQLESLGLSVDSAADGEEGLNKIEQHAFDLVLTDMNMPIIGGRELLNKIRSSKSRRIRQVPVVLITADRLEHKDMLELGASACLDKPFTKESLVSVLLGVLKDAEVDSKEEGDALVDEKVLRHHLGNNPQQVARLLSIFLGSLTADMQKIHNCLELNELQTLPKLVHKSVSPARSVGAMQLANSLVELEQMAADCDAAELAERLQSLNGIYDATVQAIQGIISANQSPQQLQEKESAGSAISEEAAPKANTFMVLAIDDDEFTLRQLEQVLSGIGSIRLDTEADAEVALETLKRQRYHFLLLDINMPKIDGIQFVRHLAELPSPPAIILYSNEKAVIASVSDLITHYGMKYVGELQKPCSQLSFSRLLDSYRKKGDHRVEKLPSVNDELIKECVQNEWVLLMYQPQVSTRINKVNSVEALARLSKPGGSLILPNDFLHRLEDLGLETVFSSLVAKRAVMQLSQWQALGIDMKMAINFSMNALEDLDLPDKLNSICEQYHVRQSSIVVEVTETVLSSRPKLALEVLVRLKISGFTLSIDDFGTGYSSLEKLQKLPFSELKLDRSYVSNASADDISRALFSSSMNLAHQLNLITVAEGVETEQDYKLAVELGVDLIQGYYFSKPLTPDALRIWLKEFNNGR